MSTSSAASVYPHLFSPFRLRQMELRNRVMFAPTCPTWISDPHDAGFTDQAVAYYEERAKTGIAMIVIGGTLIDKNSSYAPLAFPGLWDDRHIVGLARIAKAVQRHGCRLGIQLLHIGMRSRLPFFKTDSARDPDEYDAYMLGPSQIPAAEYLGGPTPKEMEEHEIEHVLNAFAAAATRAIAAGVDGVELHMAHGYLPWQFLSPLYNHRTDRWGGHYENRLRFPLQALLRIRKAIGETALLGYRINSTSFWDGDLEIDDIKRIHADLEARADIDYVSLSAGVHHSWIHSPMTFTQGWEREYTRAVKTVATKPVMLVGRVSHPDVAEDLLASQDADVILLARQMFADELWMQKVKEGRAEDIRPCVAANYCWRSVMRGARVQCIYNPVVGRERVWGTDATHKAPHSLRVLVIGAGPAGLEFARVATSLGHQVVVYEREEHAGGHVRAYGALPHRQQFGTIATWLYEQATKNGAVIKLGQAIAPETLDQVLAQESPDHIVVATGARYRRDGFQGRTAQPIPGWDSAHCQTWDQVVLGQAEATGQVLVIDELADVAAPLTAVKLAQLGAKVRLLTKWLTIGMDTVDDVYLHWVLTYLHETDVEILPNHIVQKIDGTTVTICNLYRPGHSQSVHIDTMVMATARSSDNGLYHLLKGQGHSVEMIGCAMAPRGVYEATYEGHRAARRLGRDSST